MHYATTPAAHSSRAPLEEVVIPAYMSDEDINKLVMELIVDLGNMALYTKAVPALQKLKQRKPSAFRSKEFFKDVMGLMEWNHYRLGIRRMVIDLFDKHVMRQIVFDEEESDGSDGSGQNGYETADGSSGDDRTERQRSVSEPGEMPLDLNPSALNSRR